MVSIVIIAIFIRIFFFFLLRSIVLCSLDTGLPLKHSANSKFHSHAMPSHRQHICYRNYIAFYSDLFSFSSNKSAFSFERKKGNGICRWQNIFVCRTNCTITSTHEYLLYRLSNIIYFINTTNLLYSNGLDQWSICFEYRFN